MSDLEKTQNVGDGRLEARNLEEVRGNSSGLTAAAQQAIMGEQTPRNFGTWAHSGYEQEAYFALDDAEREREVRVTKRDGSETWGKVDLISGSALIDFKTNDMRDWSAAEARAKAKEHGQQMSEYVASPDTPKNAKGWIVATVPPQSDAVRKVYASELGAYGVGVKYSASEDPADVVRAVREAVRES